MQIAHSFSVGLSDAEHSTRLSRDGPNALEGSGGIKIHVILLRQTFNFLQGVLAVSAAISIAIGEYIDAGVIAFLILINIVVGFFQEYRTERTLERLKNLSSPLATVIRDGVQKDVPSEDIVVGDIVVCLGFLQGRRGRQIEGEMEGREREKWKRRKWTRKGKESKGKRNGKGYRQKKKEKEKWKGK